MIEDDYIENSEYENAKEETHESLEETHETREETHECPICLEACTNPYTTECGHTFCKGCLMSGCHSCINKGSEEDPVAYTKCPLCRQQIKFVLFNPYTWDVVSLKDISPFCGFLNLQKDGSSQVVSYHIDFDCALSYATFILTKIVLPNLNKSEMELKNALKNSLNSFKIFYHIDQKPVDKDTFWKGNKKIDLGPALGGLIHDLFPESGLEDLPFSQKVAVMRICGILLEINRGIPVYWD